jgi:hypothetical protein
MPAYVIQDFKSGLDLRKSYVTAPAGSLRVMRNCVISAGAEIEKRTLFYSWGTFPADSLGVLSRNGLIYTVVNGASGITEATGTPPDAVPGIISLPFPSGITIDRVADWDLFNAGFYIVLHGTNDLYYHYYNQVFISDAMATSSAIRTYGSKVYGVDGRLLRFSKIGDPTKWTPPIPLTVSITGGAVNTSQVYLTFDPIAASAVPNAGAIIQVTGATPTGVNGSWPVVAGDVDYFVYNATGITPTDPIPPGGTITIQAVNDGSGYIDLSAQDSDSTDLVGLEVYYSQMAIFSKLSTQFWKLDPDPAQNQFQQLLRSTGLIAANSTTQYGNGDVMYLSSHGIRSLRIQNISLTAGTTDLGTPIDEEFRDLIINNGTEWFAQARCLIQPRSGRLFVVLPDRIYVLSTFQEPAITAWSTFDAPFQFVESCVADPYVILRGDDNHVYVYGSEVVSIYDDTEVEVITPALACESPSKTKLFHSFDVGCEGTWTMSAGCDPANQDTEEVVATFTGPTYAMTTMTMPEQSTHISLRFRSTDPVRARLGHIVIQFDDGEQS